MTRIILLSLGLLTVAACQDTNGGAYSYNTGSSNSANEGDSYGY